MYYYSIELDRRIGYAQINRVVAPGISADLDVIVVIESVDMCVTEIYLGPVIPFLLRIRWRRSLVRFLRLCVHGAGYIKYGTQPAQHQSPGNHFTNLYPFHLFDHR